MYSSSVLRNTYAWDRSSGLSLLDTFDNSYSIVPACFTSSNNWTEPPKRAVFIRPPRRAAYISPSSPAPLQCRGAFSFLSEETPGLPPLILEDANPVGGAKRLTLSVLSGHKHRNSFFWRPHVHPTPNRSPHACNFIMVNWYNLEVPRTVHHGYQCLFVAHSSLDPLAKAQH